MPMMTMAGMSLLVAFVVGGFVWILWGMAENRHAARLARQQAAAKAPNSEATRAEAPAGAGAAKKAAPPAASAPTDKPA